MKKIELIKGLISQVLRYPGFIMIWEHFTEKQKHTFLKKFIKNNDIDASLQETTGSIEIDEEEDTEEV